MYKVGDKVWDDLTRTEQTIVGVQTCEGQCDGKSYHGLVIGYWLSDPWLGGGRHPWEITALSERTRSQG